MKKTTFIMTTMFLLMLLWGIQTSFAESNGPARIQPGDTATMWKISSISTKGTYNGSQWSLRYTGYPSAEAGETDTISIMEAYNASFTGTFGVSKGTIEANVGFTAGQQFSFSVGRTSRALRKNEYVKAYIRHYYTQYTVNQEQTQMEVKVRFDESGNPILYTEETVLKTAVAYAYKPQMPQIKLEYYMSTESDYSIKNTNNVQSCDSLVETEIYEWTDNRWERVQ